MEVVSPSGALKSIYENIEKLCSKGCGTITKLKDSFRHEIMCGRPKCEAYEKCNNVASSVVMNVNCCSEKCAIYINLKRGIKISP